MTSRLAGRCFDRWGFAESAVRQPNRREHPRHHPHLDDQGPEERPPELDLDQTRVTEGTSGVVLALHAAARTSSLHGAFHERDSAAVWLAANVKVGSGSGISKPLVKALARE